MSISVEKYREIMPDKVSSDERIQERIKYIEALCRNVIRQELRKLYEINDRKN
jgi:hypothetical protein